VDVPCNLQRVVEDSTTRCRHQPIIPHLLQRVSFTTRRSVSDLQRVVEKKAYHWLHSTTRCRIITTRCRLHGTSTTAFHTFARLLTAKVACDAGPSPDYVHFQSMTPRALLHQWANFVNCHLLVIHWSFTGHLMVSVCMSAGCDEQCGSECGKHGAGKCDLKCKPGFFLNDRHQCIYHLNIRE